MSTEPGTGRPRQPLTTRVAIREQLSREELLALVTDLQKALVDQQATISRQASAIAQLQLRPAGDGPAGGESRPTSAQPTSASGNGAASRRPTARPVAGSDYTIVFDGGSRGNPGKGYGSYQIVGPNGLVTTEQCDYPGLTTNNQAELMTVIRALRDLEQQLGAAAGRTAVAIRGDSKLALNTMAGLWKAKHPNVIPLAAEARELLAHFGKVDVKWQPRAESVAILGH